MALDIAGITQSKLADVIGTTQPAVSMWLSGKKDPTEENLAACARATGVRVEWLLSGIPPMKAEDATADRAEYKTAAGWAFRRAPADGGKDFGNANVWSFDPGLDHLVREVLQNAKDAFTSPDRLVEVAFRIIRLAGDDLRAFQTALGWDRLSRHLDASRSGHQKFNTLIGDGLDRLYVEDELLLLAIEDRGTTGLTGPEFDKGNFTALCRNNLDSQKAVGAGGAFGLGKAVLWRASRLSTVLFGSNLGTPYDGRSEARVFGRCESSWHQVGSDAFAGPGWFGRVEGGNPAESYWGNRTLADDLYVGRADAGTGTTACVVGFHDASADGPRKPNELADELVKSAAKNFYPAIVAGQLAVTVEVYDSGQKFRDRRSSLATVVKPEDFVPAAVRMLKAFREDATVEALGDKPDEVAARKVILKVPKRTAEKTHPEFEHEAVLLVTPADDETSNEKPNQLAMFRGPGMIVQSKSLAGVCLGARPFHAVLVCGQATGVKSPAAKAADDFLRTAEPPSHTVWTGTPDLKAVYAHGCIKRLDLFLKAATDAVRELVKPLPKDTGDGPEALKELFRIGSEPAAAKEQPQILGPKAQVDAEGRWQVSGRVRLKAKKGWQKLTPAVYFLAETGTGIPVRCAALTAEKGCETRPDHPHDLFVPPDTRELRFSGHTDPADHPIRAADSCVALDIHKLTSWTEALK